MANDDVDAGPQGKIEHARRNRSIEETILNYLREGTPLVALVAGMAPIYLLLNLSNNSMLLGTMVVVGSSALMLASLMSPFPANLG